MAAEPIKEHFSTKPATNEDLEEDKSSKDFYRELAAEVLSKDYSEVTKDERLIAKEAVWFLEFSCPEADRSRYVALCELAFTPQPICTTNEFRNEEPLIMTGDEFAEHFKQGSLDCGSRTANSSIDYQFED